MYIYTICVLYVYIYTQYVYCVCVYIYIYLSHIFFIPSSVDGHLGCFHILAIVK